MYVRALVTGLAHRLSQMIAVIMSNAFVHLKY